MNRIDRLTAILIQLQTKRIVKAGEIASRFNISLRTVYRDVKALMEAGVPIGSEAGKGYFVVDGFHLPPVMFTQDEAGALLLAGKIVEKMADKSVRNAYESAMLKIRSVLSEAEKDHLQNLENNINIFIREKFEKRDLKEFPDHFMTEIQKAVGNKQVLEITYVNNKNELTDREVEPVGIFYYSQNWHLIAWCRLRKDYRDFRADHIKTLVNTGNTFKERPQLSLQEYFNTMFQVNRELYRVVVTFDKNRLNGRAVYGSIKQTDLGDRLRVVFPMDNLHYMAHWLLMFGPSVVVEQPEELKVIMTSLIEEFYLHYTNSAIPVKS